MRCASYTRALSISDTVEVPVNVIAIQNEKITSYIKKRHWKLVMKYSDRKKDTESETAFLEMKEGAVARTFDCIVMESIFRCGKNVVVATEVIKNMFLPVGIHFAVVEDDFCSADVSLEEAIAYLENKQSEFRSNRVAQGVRSAIEKRVYEKYGYLHKDGKMELVIDPAVEPCIKRLYELVIAGYTFAEVADHLNKERYESQRQHMRRVRRAQLPEETILWDAAQVSKLVRNRLYMGEWKRTIKGEERIFPCPPIVSPEIFEKASKKTHENSNNIGNARRKAVPNSYARRVFDKDSGCPLKAVEHQRLHIKIYRHSYPKQKDIVYEKSFIAWTDLDRMVKEEIKKECKKAKKAIKILDSERVVRLRDEQIKSIREKVQALFFQMTEIENQQIPLYQKYKNEMMSEAEYQKERDCLLQRVMELDSVFVGYMDKIYEIEKAYSKENLWIKQFGDWKMQSVLSMAQVGKIIERVDCERFERVDVQFKYEDWKAYFPDEWLQLEE